MLSDDAKTRVRRFVRGQLRAEADLSSLTLRILRRRYLARVGRECLSPAFRRIMKEVVYEELTKMQDGGSDDDDDGSEVETETAPNKRKREKEEEAVASGSEGEVESRKKKSRRELSSSSESEEEEEQVQPGSGGAEQGDVKESQGRTDVKVEQQTSGDESADGEVKSGSGRRRMKPEQSEEENGSDADGTSGERGERDGGQPSSDGEGEEKVSVERRAAEPDTSDSSSLPSLEDERSGETEEKKMTTQKKKKTVKREESASAKVQKEDNKAVVRLKRYIALCGVRRNYKKLLGDCRSVRSMVAALKKELEDLGVQGPPSIEKCKKVRMKREEAQELAELDVSNIIATQGRPKRRGASAWREQHDPPTSTYRRAVRSGSDSDQENHARAGNRRRTDWSSLQGIISDDADSG